MKKLLAIIAVIAGVFVLVTCARPTITKEQQDNMAIRIYRNYDVQEIEFLSFTKNESTGSYYLSIKLNKDENKVTAIMITDLKDLNTSEGGIGLSPVGTFEGMRREKELDIHTTTSDIKIKYLGEN
jgi:hypothetical protein